MLRILVVLATSLGWGSALAVAQDMAPDVAQNVAREPINHTVIAGETLEGLSARYFGDPQRWREIHRLNPAIENPHLLAIGLRVRVPYPDALPTDSALLTRQANRVEGRIAPRTWIGAEDHDVLRQHDALRTFDEASAELLFADETSLVVTENSLVIVGLDEPVARPEPVDLVVEIVLGQADLRRVGAGGGEREIEIVVGGAAARPKASARGLIQARARRPDAGGAQVMMYAGEGEVEAGGKKVHLPTGTGSVVAEGEAPGAPEMLLLAPAPVAPLAGSRSPSRRPLMRWREVEAAVAYTVEVCADPVCAALVARQTDVATVSWQAASLPVGDWFWRVTAVSRSGLDGFPSMAIAFAVTDGEEDREGPTIALRLAGERLQAPRSGLHANPIAGHGTVLQVAVDDPSGVAKWTPTLDGSEVAAAALSGPWSSGLHTVTVVAVDNLGNERVSAPFQFVYDPDPPVLQWGVQGSAALGNMTGRDGDAATLSSPYRGWRRWPADGRRSRHATSWRVTSDGAQVRLWPEHGKTVRLVDIDRAVNREQGLWVLAEDALCPGPPARLVYGFESQGSAGARGRRRVEVLHLIVETEDCVGNVSRMVWPLRVGRGARSE